jgi:hypothetical protein
VNSELDRQSRHPKDALVQSIFLSCKPFPDFRVVTAYCKRRGSTSQNKEQPGQGCSYGFGTRNLCSYSRFFSDIAAKQKGQYRDFLRDVAGSGWLVIYKLSSEFGTPETPGNMFLTLCASLMA